ncbi:hypothetical protein SAMN04515647_0898 [Cohaesibacter sp. ES.047]|uniref:hypothetical protein n=1 Tax=Cohaesibacter sp. ES.047 TaxID=1798205 RepID=UPI000BB8E42E|nr:hypothetical protein [Cohaesibacter sp. ES.047]SNY90725.1 hypothetical protein SAMN04515647_0898 [Cohaesibacter sp. ES.047]
MLNTIMVPVDLRRSSIDQKALTIAATLARANDIKKIRGPHQSTGGGALCLIWDRSSRAGRILNALPAITLHTRQLNSRQQNPFDD